MMDNGKCAKFACHLLTSGIMRIPEGVCVTPTSVRLPNICSVTSARRLEKLNICGYFEAIRRRQTNHSAAGDRRLLVRSDVRSLLTRDEAGNANRCPNVLTCKQPIKGLVLS